MLEIVHATLPKHVCLLEPGHIVDSRTSSFFPLQLISEEELQRFVLHFKTPPGFDRKDGDEVGRRDSRGLSDELILVYLVRAHLSVRFCTKILVHFVSSVVVDLLVFLLV